jgi:hypothetical protein
MRGKGSRSNLAGPIGVDELMHMGSTCVNLREGDNRVATRFYRLSNGRISNLILASS